MGRQIIWSPEAFELLEGVLTYWEKRNGTKTYSLKLNKLFQITLKQITRFPDFGRSVQYHEVKV